MSSGKDCRFVEVEPGHWTYDLEVRQGSETYVTYGPFHGYAAAEQDLLKNHSNPGGWSLKPLEDGRHVHEFTQGGYEVAGFEVGIKVESLGPTASREAVIAHIQSLPPEHPAFNVRSYDRYSETVRSCESCGARP